MKKFISFCFVLFLISAFSFSSFAQIRKIPSEATETFRQKYPDAVSVEWRDKISGFTAQFKLSDTTYTASFDNQGDWTGTEQEIAPEELPELVSDGYSKSKYADWEIGVVHRIELPEDVVQYRIQAVKSDLKKRNLYFNSKGRLVKDKMTL